MNELKIIKYKLIELGKKSNYFILINSIFVIEKIISSIITAELGNTNRFNNIKNWPHILY